MICPVDSCSLDEARDRGADPLPRRQEEPVNYSGKYHKMSDEMAGALSLQVPRYKLSDYQDARRMSIVKFVHFLKQVVEQLFDH